MSACSPTPLIRKLGIKEGNSIFLHQSPTSYFEWLGPLPPHIELLESCEKESLDFIHAFFTAKQDLEEQLPSLKAGLKPNAMVWISWPKGKSGVETDLNRDIIREMGLGAGLVDVKVASVNEIWSGLKFVYRLVDRK
ncbi:MAG: DUF3052 domain-containing protein [Bacteroidota bacterium]